MLNLSHLNCFVAVAEELSFSRAAARLSMTQPPLTRQIQMLEHQVGATLFERSTRSVNLTAAGRTFLTEAKQIIELTKNAAEKARRTQAGELGIMTISFVSCAIYQNLPSLIHQIETMQPGVSISLREMSTMHQLDALRLNQIDLGVVRKSPLPKGINSRLLLREKFVLAMPANHPLANQEDLTISSLHQQPFINYDPSSWRPFYDMITMTLNSHGIEPKYIHSVGSTVAILSLINGNMGMALVPEHSTTIRFDNVVFRDLPELKDLNSELLLVWHEDNDNPLLPALLDTLQNEFE